MSDEMTMMYELVTPERAKQFLESTKINRRISEVTVKAYSIDMLNKDWTAGGGSNSI